jgi:hypothetical protein
MSVGESILTAWMSIPPSIPDNNLAVLLFIQLFLAHHLAGLLSGELDVSCPPGLGRAPCHYARLRQWTLLELSIGYFAFASDLITHLDTDASSSYVGTTMPDLKLELIHSRAALGGRCLPTVVTASQPASHVGFVGTTGSSPLSPLMASVVASRFRLRGPFRASALSGFRTPAGRVGDH